MAASQARTPFGSMVTSIVTRLSGSIRQPSSKAASISACDARCGPKPGGC
jgi:hypothetical protein